tara:strand:+ start:382 stop:2400 length:2019 start_codon:yes stop_codon:yes gene_type:complete
MKTFKTYLLDEDLRKWFGKGKEGDWVRVGTDGEIKGDCAREEGEGKPKCMPRSRAHGMDKDDRAKSARRKRREDPVADRKGKGGKPVMVATEETIIEKNVPTKPALWSKYKSQAKAKFDVYPSAYANGWASKMYKKAGGGWKSVSEGVQAGVAEACWSGYKQKGMKKKGNKVVPNCVPEEMVSEMPMKGPTGSVFALRKESKSESHYTKDGKEWTGPRHSHGEQVMTGEKHTEDSLDLFHYKELPSSVKKKLTKNTEKEMGSDNLKTEGKEHSWKSEGHYTKDGKEWTGPQHAHDGQVMTGEKHTADSQDLYHYKALPADVRKKVAKTIEEKLLARKNSIGDYIKDFKKSDAPQFKGRGESKRKQMAVAAYLKSKRRDGERALGETIKYDSNMGAMDWGTPEGTEYMKDVTPGQNKKKSKAIKESLPPHLQGLLDKGGNIDPKKVSKIVHKGKKTPSGSKVTDVTPKGYGINESGAAHETKAEYRKDNAEDAPELGDYAFSKQDIKELEYEADNLSYEDALSLGVFDDEIDDTEVNITEVLSVQGRLKRRFAARKNRQKLKVARGIALRRGSSPDRLKKRATRGARGMVYKRLLKGRDKSALPPAEKGRLEKLIGMYAPLVSRLAVRMLPGMRKMEINRMKSRKAGTKSSKKYKAARPTAKKQTAKKFKIKK